MTGTEITRAIRNYRGKVSIPSLFGANVPYIYAEKQDLIQYFAAIGDEETGLVLRSDNGDAHLAPQTKRNVEYADL